MKEDNKPSSVAYGCDIMKCPKCGRDIPDNAIYCSYCGARLTGFREVVIGPHPVLSMVKGAALFIAALFSLIMLITSPLAHMPLGMKFTFLAVFVALFVIGLVYLVYGMRGKVVPVYKVEERRR